MAPKHLNTHWKRAAWSAVFTAATLTGIAPAQEAEPAPPAPVPSPAVEPPVVAPPVGETPAVPAPSVPGPAVPVQAVPAPRIPTPDVPPPNVPPPSIPPAVAQTPALPPPPAPAPAVPVRVDTQLSAREISVEDQAILAIRIVSGDAARIEDYPQEIVIEGLEITYAGMNRTFSRPGMPRNMELRYMVSGKAPGQYVIPAQTLRVDGQEMTTRELTLTVNDGPPVADGLLPTVQLSVGKTEIWLGEVVPVKVTVLVHPSVQPVSQLFPALASDGFAVNRFDRGPGIDSQIVNGEVWRAWQMESALSALKPGDLTLGPAQLKTDVMMPLAGAMRDPFGGIPSARKALKLDSNTVAMKVKPLPVEGRPDTFTGAVGEFEMVIDVSPREVKIGDPVAVELRVSGEGNFDSVLPPQMESTDGWRVYPPRVSLENRGWGTESGEKGFTQILFPEKNLSELAPFVLTYFNPVTGKYVTVKTEPVPLTVTGSPRDAASTGGTVQDFAGGGEAAIPGEELGDILTKPVPSTASAWMKVSDSPPAASRWLQYGLPGGAILFVLAGGFLRRWRAECARRAAAAGQPRPPAAIIADLRRAGPERAAFYQKVSEFLTSWEYHRKGPPPLPGTPAGDALQLITGERDRRLYGPEAAAVDALPDGEISAVLAAAQRLA